MDVNNEEVTEAIRAAAMVVPDVRGVSDLRMRWLGRELEVRMIVQLPAGLTLTQVHEVGHWIQDRVRSVVADVRR